LKVYAVILEWRGLVEEVYVFKRRKDAEKKRKKLKRGYREEMERGNACIYLWTTEVE